MFQFLAPPFCTSRLGHCAFFPSFSWGLHHCLRRMVRWDLKPHSTADGHKNPFSILLFGHTLPPGRYYLYHLQLNSAHTGSATAQILRVQCSYIWFVLGLLGHGRHKSKIIVRDNFICEDIGQGTYFCGIGYMCAPNGSLVLYNQQPFCVYTHSLTASYFHLPAPIPKLHHICKCLPVTSR